MNKLYTWFGMMRAKWTVMSVGEQRAASWHAVLDALILYLFMYSFIYMLRGESIYTTGVAIWAVVLYFRWKQARERWSF